jgi:MSHA biogenesis protein MshN
MSLINKMLRDLDQRQASATERAGLAASQVRALPPERRFPWSRVLLVLTGAVVGATGLWLLIDGQARTHLPVNLAVPGPLAPSAPVQPSVPPAAEPAPPGPAIAMPALVVPMPGDERDEPVAATRVESLQLDLRLSQPPVPIRNEPARPEAVVRARGPAETVPAVIDKRPHDVPGGNSAEAEYRKAMAAYRQGRSSEALPAFQNALRLDDRHVAARQALLSLLMEQGRWPEAQAVASEGLAVDAAQPGWAMILARLQVEQGQVAAARETMARHAAHAERSADYQAFHALLLQKLQRPKEAVDRFRAATSLRPNEGRWWYGLGLALEADQRPQEAREAFRQARETGNLPAELAAGLDQHPR